jgi:hypothetical protein
MIKNLKHYLSRPLAWGILEGMRQHPVFLYAVSFIILGASLASAGTTSLSTYYPAPDGNYNKASISYSETFQPSGFAGPGGCPAQTANTVSLMNIGGILGICQTVAGVTTFYPLSGNSLWLPGAGNTFMYPATSTQHVDIGATTDLGYMLGVTGDFGTTTNSTLGAVASKATNTTTINGSTTMNGTAGTTALSVSPGNVGIGVATARNILDVNGSMAVGTYAGSNTATANGLIVSGNVGIANTSPAYPLDVTGNLRSSAEVISSAPAPVVAGIGGGNIRMIAGNYGAFWRNDGANTYLLFTASGSQYGQWNALRPFYINDATGAVNIDGTAVGTTFGGGASFVSGGVTITSAGGGTVTASSDMRLKQNILPLTNVLPKLDQLRGVTFKWNNVATSMGYQQGSKDNIGVIAQDMQKVFPELVVLNKAKDGKEYLSVDYMKFSAVLLQSIKELKGQMAGMQKQLKAQQEEINELKKKSGT